MKPSLGDQRASIWAGAGFATIAGVGFVDFITGYEIGFSLFYLLPISAITWYSGKRLGVIASVAGALTWLIADVTAGHVYSHPVIHYWNTLIRFSFFIIVTLLLYSLKKAHEHERELARFDNLTGAVNGRYFGELMQMEIDRSQRYKQPFTVAYVDLDNFKMVNDQYGHSTGDRVLHLIVQITRQHLRKIDVVARLGGDEFAILLPGSDQAAARTAVSKIQTHLLEEMHRNNWPVTFSIGVLTCRNAPQTTDLLIKQADALMYSVKNNGKDAVNYAIC